MSCNLWRNLVLVGLVLGVGQASGGFSYENIEEPLRTAIAESIKKAEHAEADKQDDEVAKAWGETGMLFQAHNMYESAIEAYTYAINLSIDPRWLYLRGVCYGEMGEAQSALADLERLPALGQDVPMIWYRIGEIHLRLANPVAAEAVLRRAVEGQPEFSVALYKLAESLQLLGNLNEARELYLAVHKLDPNAGQVVYRLAQLERSVGNEKLSATWLSKRKNQLAPTVNDPLLRFVAQFSTNPVFFISASKRAYERGDMSAAVAAFSRAVQLEPQNVENLLEFARLLRYAELPEEAHAILTQVGTMGEPDFDLWYLQALVFADLKKFEDALTALSRAIMLDPKQDALRLRDQIESVMAAE